MLERFAVFSMDDEALSMRLQMARQYLQAGQMDQAEILLEKLLAANPANSEVADFFVKLLRSQAAKLAQSGQLDAARTRLRRVLEIDPGHADSLFMLTRLAKHHEYGQDLQNLERRFAEADLNTGQRRRLAFALGKAFDDLGEYPRAFEYLVEGNRIARGGIEYSAEVRERHWALLRRCFDADYSRRCRNLGSDDDRLILVTGLPRSGTTLVEQILACHPLVHGGGELRLIEEVVTAAERRCGLSPLVSGFDQAHPGAIAEMAAEYCSGLAALSPDKPYVTDKNLGTVAYLGLVAAMLPRARIVHCVRDPRDQGLSVFMNDFGSQQPHAYDLEEIAHYTALHDKQMRYWKTVLPGPIFTLRYEELVANPEANIRALLDHCGLNFSEECLAFHESKRAVNTLSLAQVRRPLHSGSVGRWKNYADQMPAFFNALTERRS